MKEFKKLLAVSIMFSLPSKRNPIWHLVISIIPIALLTMFYFIGGSKLSLQAMLGSLIVFSMNSGIVSLPQLVVFLKARQFQDIFVASPIHPVTYTFGIALSRLLYVTPVLLIMLIVLVLNGTIAPQNIPITLFILFLVWLTGSAIGFTIATYVENVLYISSISNLLGLILTLIPPVYYPLSFIPGKIRYSALLLPTSSAAELLRISNDMSDKNYTVLWISIIVLIAYLVSAIILVSRKSRWREK